MNVIDRRKNGAWLAAAFRVLLAGVVVLAIGSTSSPTWATGAPESFADLAAKLLPTVVNISTTQSVKGRKTPERPQLPPGSPFEDFFKDYFERNRPQERQRRVTSLGSGFVVDAKGYVVTNNHVIKDADEITVIFHDNTRLKAKVVGRDKRTDLAVLKVDSDKPLPATHLGDSDTARVGDWVVAIGNPFGLGGTVTAGIISARGRDINAGPYDDFIQTDASINRGNSGGPMFNLKGEVIGINTAIFSPTGGSVGIGFAIPSSIAKPVIDQLIGGGQVRRGWLGVHIQAVTDEIAETLGLHDNTGALVASVMKDGPAEKAKIKAGDVILKFGGKKVSEMRKLPRIVAATPINGPVDVVIWRDRKEIVLRVTVGELDDAKIESADGSGDDEKGGEEGELTIDSLGLTLSPMSARLRDRYDLNEKLEGVVITRVKEASVAGEKGLQPGAVIVEVSQEVIKTPADVKAKIKEARASGRKSVLFLIKGKQERGFVVLRIDKG